MKRKIYNAKRRAAAALLLTYMFLLICSCNSSVDIAPSVGQDPGTGLTATTGEQADKGAAADARQAARDADTAAQGVTDTEDAGKSDTQHDVTSSDTATNTSDNSLYTCHTEAQVAYLAGDYKLYKSYANGTEELSSPMPYVLPNGEEKYNLLLGETYSYTYTDDTGNEQSAEVTTDALPPRNLYVKGVTNVRDLGGWSSADGHKVKQGMIFRSSKFNADESTDLMIEPEGIDTMVNVLGVRTEIDLREDDERGNITASPLGESVNYISIPMTSGGNIILLNKDVLPGLFEIFADEANYPIVFHCSIGTDRTGMVAFLINGLLGVSEDDLYRDFLFSNFGMIGKLRTPSIIKTYIRTVEMSSGADLSAKVYAYLKDAGVSEENLESVKRIMTE